MVPDESIPPFSVSGPGWLTSVAPVDFAKPAYGQSHGGSNDAESSPRQRKQSDAQAGLDESDYVDESGGDPEEGVNYLV